MSEKKKNHHHWVGDRCQKCGIIASQARSLLWGCNKAQAQRSAGRRSKQRKKGLPE